MKLYVQVYNAEGIRRAVKRVKSGDGEVDDVALESCIIDEGLEALNFAPIFSALSASPLVKLEIWWNRGTIDVGPLPIALLAPTIRATRGTLQSLRSGSLPLAGDLEALTNALMEHPSLLKMDWQGLSHTSGRECSWDALLSSLGTCLCLQETKLHFLPVGDGPVSTMGSGLVDLCSSRTLEKLAVESLEVSDSCSLESVFCALQHNTCLKSFSLCPNRIATGPVGQMLRHNSSLESLQISIARPSTEFLQPLVEALRHQNRSLRSLTLNFPPTGRLEGDDLSLLTGMMRHNTILENLIVSPATRRRFLAGVDPVDHDTRFFLHLNRNGRHHLLKEASREEWVQEIIQRRANVPIVFYYLSINPSLLQ